MTYPHKIKEYRRVAASGLRANPANFRKHPAKQMAALRGSLRQVGKIAPLIAYDDPEHGLTLIDGHARLDEDTTWDVAIVDLTPDEARLAMALLDPIAALAETDAVALRSLLDSVATDDEAVQAHLDNMETLNGIGTNAELDDDPTVVDKAAELLEKWQVQGGDVWHIGNHTLVCGDSTDPDTVAKALAGRVPFLMVTDPPYGVEYEPEWRNKSSRSDGKPIGARAIGKVTNDDNADWRTVYALSGADVVYVWHPSGATQCIFLQSLVGAGYEIRNTLIWAKDLQIIGRGHYHPKHESCFYAVKHGQNSRWCGDRKQTTVWDIPTINSFAGGHNREEWGLTGHSTQKPIECMARPIRNHGAKGDLIYDPFCGSGTTLVACEQEGRVGVGIELEPRYVAVVLERMSKMGLEVARG